MRSGAPNSLSLSCSVPLRPLRESQATEMRRFVWYAEDQGVVQAAKRAKAWGTAS